MDVQPTADADERPQQRSFARSAAWSFATNVTVAALGVVNVLVMARALGATGRGETAFVFTVASLTAVTASLGVEQAHANLAARQPELRRRLGGNSLALALLLGTVTALLVALLAGAFPAVGGDVPVPLRTLALCSVPLLVLEAYLVALVQAGYAFTVWNLAWLITPVTTLVGNLAFWAAGSLTPTRALVLWIGGHVLAVTLLAGYVARRLSGFGAPDWRLGRQALGFGLRSHPGRVMTVSNYRVDQWFVGALAGSRELGVYSVAVAWSEALFFLPTVLTKVQRPDLAKDSRTAAGRRAALVFRSCVLLTLPLALGLVAAAPVLTGVLFGDEFRGAADELRVLTVGAFGIAAVKLLGDAVVAQRRPGLSAIGPAVAFVLTIGLDVALIPRYGAMGAALASTAAYVGGGIACAAVFAKVLDVRGRDLVPRPSDAVAVVRQVRKAVGRG